MDDKYATANPEQNNKMIDVYRNASEPHGVHPQHLVNLESGMYALYGLNIIQSWPYASIDRSRFSEMLTNASAFLYMARYTGILYSSLLTKIKPGLIDLHTTIMNLDEKSEDRTLLGPSLDRACHALYSINQEMLDHEKHVQEQETRQAARARFQLVQ